MDEATRELFGRTLRQLRSRAKLSQPQLARRIPVSQATLSRYESGKQSVDPAMAARLDDLLDAGGALRVPSEFRRSSGQQRTPRTLLERLIQESDYSIEEHCANFERRAHELGEPSATLSTRQLGRWMAGGVATAHPASRRVAKQLWGHSFQQLMADPQSLDTNQDDIPPQPSGDVDQTRIADPQSPDAPDPAPSLTPVARPVLAESWEGIDLRRREMLGLAGGVIAEHLLVPMEHTRRLVDSALRMPPSESDADEWEQVADEYSRLVGNRVPIVTVLHDLLTDFDEIRVRIEVAPEKVRNRLVRVAALLGALIAISLLCAGRNLEATRYWRTAQRAADSVDDPRLAGLIRGRRAIYELYQRVDGRRTLNLANTAVELAGSGASVGKASALAARAQILAMNGAGSAAMESLSQLERDFARLPESAPANDSSQWSWSEQRLRFVQSFVHSYAGNTAEAQAAQEAALLLYPESSYRGPAQIEFHRAIAVIVNGDQFGGAQCVLAALETVPADLRTDRMILQPASFALDMVRDSTVKLRAKMTAHELIDPSADRS